MRVWLIFCWSLLFVVFSYGLPKEVNKAIFFGDSLSDVGNYPVGSSEPYVPVTNPYQGYRAYYGGSVGVIWPQIITRELYNQGGFSSPFVVASRVTNQRNHQVTPDVSLDYAWASAVTGDVYTNRQGQVLKECSEPSQRPLCIPGLAKQVGLYLDAHQGQADPKAVYFLWAGGNDMFNNIANVISLRWTRIAWSPAQNIADAAAKLANAGARHIIIINLPNVAYTPALVQKKYLKGLVTFITRHFNQHLKDDSIQALMPYKVQPVVVDVAKLFEDIYMKKRPFETLKIRNLANVCQEDQKAAEENCSNYLFWNKKHPAWLGSQIIAKAIINDVQAMS
ncbi:Esterase EstP precursor [Piscirickettsia salmonis]|uniref:SGNH/GDSL hydrolase family protein n=1 Tax=Piscirickettsia salmonis TaxID=1238 RepID=UPI0012B745FE|nr:SGNH/GDSL hydrolase family protein [Piscirickettsia salmonis]QGP51824.1 Esterase EstP precursor [Piscirickettsia salmonis]